MYLDEKTQTDILVCISSWKFIQNRVWQKWFLTASLLRGSRRYFVVRGHNFNNCAKAKLAVVANFFACFTPSAIYSFSKKLNESCETFNLFFPIHMLTSLLLLFVLFLLRPRWWLWDGRIFSCFSFSLKQGEWDHKYLQIYFCPASLSFSARTM